MWERFPRKSWELQGCLLRDSTLSSKAHTLSNILSDFFFHLWPVMSLLQVLYDSTCTLMSLSRYCLSRATHLCSWSIKSCQKACSSWLISSPKFHRLSTCLQEILHILRVHRHHHFQIQAWKQHWNRTHSVMDPRASSFNSLEFWAIWGYRYHSAE